MLLRAAHYWLCCTAFNTDDVVAELQGVETRVQLAPRPTSQFGPYDYVFIDASDHDQLLDLLLEQLLEKLEPHANVLQKWGTDLTHGVEVVVRTSDKRYSETVAPETLGRLARLKLNVSFTYEQVPPTPLEQVALP